MLDYIKALFDDVEDKVGFLGELFGQGRQDEAITLCCVYIDGLANSLWPGDSSNRNFVRALTEFGAIPQLTLYHPLALTRWLKAHKGAKFRSLASKVEAGFGKDPKPMEESALRSVLAGVLTRNELQLVDPHLWRATIAQIAYDRVRVPWIHKLRGYGAVLVGDASAAGAALLPLDFHLLHAALANIVRGARELSERTGKLFGHDFGRVTAAR